MPTAVILLSDKRSGSTMLQEELCKHSGVRRVGYSPHTYHETHHWLKAAVVLERPEALFSGDRTYRGYGGRENARAYLVDTLKGNIPGYVPPEDDEALVFDGWEALCRHHAQPVFFEKSPQILAHWGALSLMLEWIRRTEMTVKVIGLVRNPLAVQYSAQALFSTEAESRQFGWLEVQRNLLTVQAMLPAESFRLIRYEDVIATPRERFAELCAFLDLAPEPQLGADAHAQSREKWRADPAYVLQLDRSVTQMARRFDYEEAELVNPHASPNPTKAARPRRARGGTRLRQIVARLRDRVVRPAILRLRSITEARR